jgi:hypothetical protein
MLKEMIFAAAVISVPAIASAQESTMTGPIYEIAIQEVKNGDVAEWTAARAPLLQGLAANQGRGGGLDAEGLLYLPRTRPVAGLCRAHPLVEHR